MIVAGGSGKRMKSSLPKQFLLLKDQPILMHTIGRFVQAIEDIHIILVLPKDQFSLWNQLCSQLDFDIPHTLVEGGETRFHSVSNGLKHCPEIGVVGIHDGVRPIISTDLIQRCFSEAEQHGSALPVVKLSQSLRQVNESDSLAVNRDQFVAVQTPQCFLLDQLKPAFDVEYNERFTDDATVFESAGNKIHLVEGEDSNLKITNPTDLRIAEAFLELMQ